MRCQVRDPVFEENGEWFFWDETWTDRNGPFPTEEAARKRIREYAVFLDTGRDPAREGGEG